jgi:hypothetical protein
MTPTEAIPEDETLLTQDVEENKSQASETSVEVLDQEEAKPNLRKRAAATQG